MTSSPTTRKHTSRKVKALLAGGLVLGVGAAVTLAAWTDTEWATGNFSAGTFGIEGSTDGAAYDDHETVGEAATLTFNLTGGENLSPGDVTSAPFALRTIVGTSYGASVELTSAVSDGPNAANLTYGIVTVADAAACNPEATGTAIVPAGTALDSFAGAATFDLAAATTEAAGTAVTLCFQVAAGDDLIQGETASASWEFIGTSVE
ncbi:SipW-dependent-type signal peptide-containing protein [Glutamicibacter uratoxydans]|uniref:SipW-dependent-type signal peptide-containing protein n=1 Tax=Glutamicibacter uratoxydans TaxID=43667 RepID=UPI003D700D50